MCTSANARLALLARRGCAQVRRTRPAQPVQGGQAASGEVRLRQSQSHADARRAGAPTEHHVEVAGDSARDQDRELRVLGGGVRAPEGGTRGADAQIRIAWIPVETGLT